MLPGNKGVGAGGDGNYGRVCGSEVLERPWMREEAAPDDGCDGDGGGRGASFLAGG